MQDYIPNSKKTGHIKQLINEALEILESIGIPFAGKTPRGLEQMAMSFLAVAGVNSSWKQAQGQSEGRNIKTRAIIEFNNAHFEEQTSPGSYDDVRRKHLKLLTLADIILNSANNPSAAHNDPTRGYTLSNEFKSLVRVYGSEEWPIKLKLFVKNNPSLKEVLQRKRDSPKIRITLPSGHILDFSRGEHNQLQREIIEELLPRFGFGCEVLYVGDTTDKFLLREDDKLKELGFFELSKDSLPDVVAYNKDKNWIYLIEAFHSTGTISEIRLVELKKSLIDCKADLVFITAFTSRAVFRKNVADIAWETEVWTADHPDHMVHFNGGKFLRPFGNKH